MSSTTSPDTRSIAESIPGGLRVFDAMADLLARAGLSYSGGFVTVRGQRTHYLDYGPGAGADPQAPPLMLLHGAGPGATAWRRQIAALSVRRRVLAMDSPLFGLSDLAEVGEHPAPFGARFAAAFMDAMGIETADVAGLSLGGAVALRLATTHTQRVRRIAILDAASLGREIPVAWRMVNVPLAARALVGRGRLARVSFERYEVSHPELPDADAYLEYALAVRARPGRQAAYRAGMRRFISWRGQRLVFSDDELRAVRQPALVLWGAEDKVFPVAHGERAARLAPDARLDVIDDAGHVCIWDQAEEANRLMSEFLDA